MTMDDQIEADIAEPEVSNRKRELLMDLFVLLTNTQCANIRYTRKKIF